MASTVTVTTTASETSQPNTNAAPLLTPRLDGNTIMNVVSGIGSNAIARPIKMRSNVIAAAPVSPGLTTLA